MGCVLIHARAHACVNRKLLATIQPSLVFVGCQGLTGGIVAAEEQIRREMQKKNAVKRVDLNILNFCSEESVRLQEKAKLKSVNKSMRIGLVLRSDLRYEE